MAYSLLDYVQQILSSMDSDEVNSITDTPESMQVANIVRTAWDDIVARLNLPEHYQIRNLTATGALTPTVMLRPNEQNSIDWVRYDRQTVADPVVTFHKIFYRDLEEFLTAQDGLTETDSNTTSVTVFEGFTYLVRNDISPQYYTTADDRTIIFDSYDSAVDASGLVGSKSQIYGIEQQSFSISDNFLPFLDPDFQILLLNEAKVLAFLELKQVEHVKAERTAKREWVHSQYSKRAVDQNRNELSRLSDYGRKSGTGYRTSFPYTKQQRDGA